MRVKYYLHACVDCIAYAANGTVPEDRPDLEADIAAELGDGGTLVCAFEQTERGDSVDDWFSWSPCECCGSRLGGNRNRLAVLEG